MIAPPRRAELLLEALGAETGFRDALLGDLAEEFAARLQRNGVRAARRWYYREAIRATPHLLRVWWRRLRLRDVGNLAGVVLTSYVFLALLLGLVLITARSVAMALGFGQNSDPFMANGWLVPLVGLLLSIVAGIVGGYIAAWLDERAPLANAFALGVAWSCAAVSMGAILGTTPVWYRVSAALAVLVCAVLGGIHRAWTVPHLAPKPVDQSATTGG